MLKIFQAAALVLCTIGAQKVPPLYPHCYIDSVFKFKYGENFEDAWRSFIHDQQIQQDLGAASKSFVERFATQLEFPIRLVRIGSIIQGASFDFPFAFDGSSLSSFSILELCNFSLSNNCAVSNVEKKILQISPIDTIDDKVGAFCYGHGLSGESCEIIRRITLDYRQPYERPAIHDFFDTSRIPLTVNHSNSVEIQVNGDVIQVEIAPFDDVSLIAKPICELYSLSHTSCARLQNQLSLKRFPKCQRSLPALRDEDIDVEIHYLKLSWTRDNHKVLQDFCRLLYDIPVHIEGLLQKQLAKLIENQRLTIPVRFQNENATTCLDYDDLDMYFEALHCRNHLYSRQSAYLYKRLLQKSRGVPWNHRPNGESFETFIAKRTLARISRRNTYENEFDTIVRTGKIEAPTAFGPSPISTHTEGSFMLTASHKLFHDEEQIRYLIERSLLPVSFERYADVLRTSRIEYVEAGAEYRVMSPKLYDMMGDIYNTVLYLPSGPTAGSIYQAVNPNLDFEAITEDYFSHSGYGVAVIDNFLTPAALAALIDFCNEATIFFDIKPGYLGAYYHRGLAIDLFAQIEDELRYYFPKVLAEHALKNLWSYKYDGDLGGIRIHADDAAVNFNFWITPDDANLDRENGGLIVYTKAAPLADDLKKWNSVEKTKISAMHEFIETSGADPVNIPYRQNRAVLFNSDLLHETAPFRFKKGYTNRRINLTMLFGDRQPRE